MSPLARVVGGAGAVSRSMVIPTVLDGGKPSRSTLPVNVIVSPSIPLLGEALIVTSPSTISS